MTFLPIARLQDLEEGFRRVLRVAGHEYLFLHSGGESYLIDRYCPHAGASLEQGTIDREFLTCPRHGLRFSLISGSATGATCPALGRYTLSYDGNRIGVHLPGE